jgi:hypothetical protein
LKELHLLIKVGIDPLVKLLVVGMWRGHCFYIQA